MKLNATFYLKQLGFSQYDISTLIDLMLTGPMINGDRCSGPTNQDSECLTMTVCQKS